MSLSVSEAERIWWCLEMPDAVHAAEWTRDGGGWLTTLVEADEVVVCYHQQAVTISELRDGLVKPWRDRKMFGGPICEKCDDDVNETEALIEMTRDMT